MISFNSSSVLHSFVVGRMRVTEKNLPVCSKLRMCYFKMKICEGKIWKKTVRTDWTARLVTRRTERFR